jgi:hypothetical protein
MGINGEGRQEKNKQKLIFVNFVIVCCLYRLEATKNQLVKNCPDSRKELYNCKSDNWGFFCYLNFHREQCWGLELPLQRS